MNILSVSTCSGWQILGGDQQLSRFCSPTSRLTLVDAETLKQDRFSQTQKILIFFLQFWPLFPHQLPRNYKTKKKSNSHVQNLFPTSASLFNKARVGCCTDKFFLMTSYRSTLKYQICKYDLRYVIENFRHINYISVSATNYLSAQYDRARLICTLAFLTVRVAHIPTRAEPAPIIAALVFSDLSCTDLPKVANILTCQASPAFTLTSSTSTSTRYTSLVQAFANAVNAFGSLGTFRACACTVSSNFNLTKALGKWVRRLLLPTKASLVTWSRDIFSTRATDRNCTRKFRFGKGHRHHQNSQSRQCVLDMHFRHRCLKA